MEPRQLRLPGFSVSGHSRIAAPQQQLHRPMRVIARTSDPQISVRRGMRTKSASAFDAEWIGVRSPQPQSAGLHLEHPPSRSPAQPRDRRQRIFVAVRAIEQQHALVACRPARAPAPARHAASTAPPSGQSSMPSSRAASSTACRICLSSTRRSPRRRFRAPRAGSGNRRPPWARGCRSRPSPHLPSARRTRRPARTRGRSARSLRPGPHTSAAASDPISPTASSSSNAFHMPIRPVPPPVG